MSGSTLRVSFTVGARRPLSVVVADLSYEDLGDYFSVFHPGAKADALAIIPAELVPCPSPCRNHLRAKSSKHTIDCGGSRHHRLAANVVSMCLLGIDADTWSVAERDACLDKIEARGFTYWAHSTSSYNPPTAAKTRIFVPFSAAVPINSSREWRDRLRPTAFRLVGLDDLADAADPACSDPSRLYFLPRKPSDAAPCFARQFQGRPIDVAELVHKTPRLRFITSVTIDEWSKKHDLPAEPGSIALGPLRALMRGYSRVRDKSKRRDLVRRALAGEPLAEEGARDDSIHRLVSTLAFLLPPTTPKEVMLELIRASISSLPGQEHESGMTWLEIAGEKWERAVADRLQADAEKTAFAVALNERFFPPRTSPGSDPEAHAEEVGGRRDV